MAEQRARGHFRLRYCGKKTTKIHITRNVVQTKRARMITRGHVLCVRPYLFVESNIVLFFRVKRCQETSNRFKRTTLPQNRIHDSGAPGHLFDSRSLKTERVINI